MFRVTYDIVTPESAEDGGVAERGFVLPGSWRVDIETAMADTEGEYGMSLREALRLVYPREDCGCWWSESDGDTDYRTGGVETRSLHPPRNITPSSYRRVSRLLGL